MIYSKKDKVRDLGKLRATNYKFNKYVCLPKPETTYREAIHEIRKAEMMKVFKRTVGGSKNDHKVTKVSNSTTLTGKDAPLSDDLRVCKLN